MGENGTVRSRLGRTVAIALAAASGIAISAGPAQADGAQTFNYSFRGDLAEARFFSADPSGCVVTETFVHVTDGRIRFEPGQPDASSVVFVGISRYDHCSQLWLTRGAALKELPGGTLQTGGHDEATLDATVQMFDEVTWTWRSIDLQLQWTANGVVERSHEHERIDFPGFRVNSRLHGTTYYADVSGSVSDGISEYAGTAGFGSITAAHDGDVVIIH